MKKIAFLLAALVAFGTLQAQENRVISGKVTILNDLPVQGVKVIAKNSKAAVNTDSLGNYTLICASNDKLAFESECFSNTQKRINSKTGDTVNVKLNFRATEKNLDLAIGYGYISEELRTQAVQSLDRTRDYSNYLTIYDVIRANFNGITITNTNCIIVRGINTINASPCAAYVVNGSFVNDIDYISPTEVKEISLLKDGSAAIYGSRSANGVFIINLKDGIE